MIPPRNISERTERVSPGDEFFGNAPCFGGENIFLQPVVEAVVVRKATEKAHGRVSVSVDQTRKHQRTARVDCFACAFAQVHRPAFAHGSDRVSAHYYHAIFDHTTVCIHRDYRPAGDEEVQDSP